MPDSSFSGSGWDLGIALMPEIRINCPHCQTILYVDSEESNRPKSCPSCRKEIRPQTELDPKPDKVRWFCSRSEREMLGPFSFDWLRYLVRCGQLLPTDQVWHEGMPVWAEASSIDDLFDQPDSGESALEEDEDAEVNLEEFFGVEPPNEEEHGPISLQGIRVHQGLTLTWDDFQVVRKVGSGNMGAVYLARQKSVDREVALKVLFKHLTRDPKFVDRFHREADSMQRLDHPALVQCYGVGVVKGCPYLAMEYIRGHNTSQILQRLGGRFEVGDALHIIMRCLEGLGHAHVNQIVHRDFKPENVMLDHLGYVKITDMGLAKPLDEDMSLTETGVGMGTPKYMAPEQGRNAKAVDPRSDIYAVGGVLYTFLTGQPPFEADTPVGLLEAKELGQYKEAHRINREVPSRLSLIVDKMLARDPAHRFSSCEEVIATLATLELAHPILKFDLESICEDQPPVEETDLLEDRVEILLVHDSRDIITMATEALDQSHINSNLNVVESGDDALEFLKRQGTHAKAPRPNLIVLGFQEGREDVENLLEAFKNNTWLHGIPMCILAPRAKGADAIRERGLPVKLIVDHPDQLPELEQLIQSVHEMCITVVEWPPKP